jgi:hypothetical protein
MIHNMDYTYTDTQGLFVDLQWFSIGFELKITSDL